MQVVFKRIVRLVRQHWLTVSFLLGFITDILLLNRIDSLFDNLVLLFYVVVATIALLLFYIGVAEWGPGVLARFLKRAAPLAMQYAFGGLLSGMLIFYGRSGDWLASAPFLLLIIGVAIWNELVEKRSDRLVYHLALYFIGLYSYIVLVVPVLLGQMGNWIFIMSGLLAVLWVTIVAQLLYGIIPNFMQANTRRVIMTIGTIYIGFNTLYFTNIIPPIPLSLTELALVQSVDRLTDGTYRVVYETQPWYRKVPFVWPVLHPTGASIACFARVYAPTKLTTEIFHRWQYRDATGVWQDRFYLGYKISGANTDGYRGYTTVSSIQPGLWRCSVETKRGQVLGRQTVQLETTGSVQPLQTLIR